MFFKRHVPSRRKRTYLDFAASTPVDEVMLATFPRLSPLQTLGNPGALHKEGLAAKRLVDESRERIARVIRAHGDEIIFTPSATEANNLALIGTVGEWRTQGILHDRMEIITTELEHPSVLETAKALGREGVPITFLEMNDQGFDVATLLPRPQTTHLLVSCMYVHNELGIIFPLKDIAKRLRFVKKERPDIEIIFHTDATQAPNTLSIDIPTLGVDMLSVGATKLYTHKGAAMLYKKRGLTLRSPLHGGGQEYGLVPGTEPVYLIDLFSRAFVYAQKYVGKLHKKLSTLQNYFEKKIKAIPSISIDDAALPRSSHITHISIPSFDSELLVLELDARGIAVSSQSACTDVAPADGYMKQRFGETTGLLRFSFGRTTTKKHLRRALEALKEVLEKYRNKV